MWIWLGIIVGVVALDQLTKWLAVTFLTRSESVAVIPGVLQLTYVENEGAAFGMLSEHRWVFMIISTVAILAMLVYLWKFRPTSRFACTALSMVIGGGIGNMIDRVYLNYVIDFIDFCAFPELWVWVFNVADACVCVGGVMLALWCILTIVAEAKEEKAAKAAKKEKAENGDGSEDASHEE